MQILFRYRLIALSCRYNFEVWRSKVKVVV